jgi:hypothetical protein
MASHVTPARDRFAPKPAGHGCTSSDAIPLRPAESGKVFLYFPSLTPRLTGWEAIFKDAMMAAAAIDRLVHHCVIVELNVPSYRAEQAKKARRTTTTI